MDDGEEVMTDVEAFEDDGIRQFLQERAFDNPHAVVVNANEITFKGSGEKLDEDMHPISINVLEEDMTG
ncbi:hypothetical protein THAOC_04626, partial [Thalassiosira oceanica]